MYFFTSDQHFSHNNIISYCKRPFKTIEEHDHEIIKRHNEVVYPNDFVVHGGDFTLKHGKTFAQSIINQLNGNHIFLRGSHDYWIDKSAHERWERKIDGQYIVVDHYAGRVWPRSYYGSWQLHGHSHGNLPPIGLQYDIGVDNNDFYPVSFTQLKTIFEDKNK